MVTLSLYMCELAANDEEVNCNTEMCQVMLLP